MKIFKTICSRILKMHLKIQPSTPGIKAIYENITSISGTPWVFPDVELIDRQTLDGTVGAVVREGNGTVSGATVKLIDPLQVDYMNYTCSYCDYLYKLLRIIGLFGSISDKILCHELDCDFTELSTYIILLNQKKYI